MKRRFYLSGPMSGIPEHNFPQFRAVTKELRGMGFDIVSPAELDEQSEEQELSWAEYLARDITIIVDGTQGMIFLPSWTHSRGAKLEAFTGLLQPDFEFYQYSNGVLNFLSHQAVLESIVNAMGAF